jgi:hypothetical protein
MPLTCLRRISAANSGPQAQPSYAHHLVAHLDAAFVQQILSVPERQEGN